VKFEATMRADHHRKIALFLDIGLDEGTAIYRLPIEFVVV